MADDRHYVPGDYYRICDMTGFKVRVGQTAKEWNGLIVRKKSWEARQPQDFVRGVVDDQSVSEPRSRQVNVFIGPLTTELTANVGAGSNTLSVTSSVRFVNGDVISLPLNNGNTYTGAVAVVTTATSFTITPVLPYSAATGVVVTNHTAIAQPDIG